MLPSIIYPTFTIKHPKTKKELVFRRYLVKEEKILLLAKESKEISEIFRAIKSVVGACCQEPDFNVEEIPLHELEYFYLRLRSASVNNLEHFSITDSQDQQKYEFTIDFDEIEVVYQENAPSENIKVDNNIILVMRYPAASIYNDNTFKKRLLSEGIFELVVSCVKAVYNKDEILEMTKEELSAFVDGLDVKTYKKIEEFLFSTPSIKYVIPYKNSLNNEREVVFSSLIDFFLYL
jgi:hypothetical protein